MLKNQKKKKEMLEIEKLYKTLYTSQASSLFLIIDDPV